MEKYAVQIDPKKLKSKKEKLAGEGAGAGNAENPNVNVPMDPERGTEPYEKERDGESK